MAVSYHDYYETLAVPRTATSDEIRAAYRKLARKYHPDINKEPGAEDRFKQIAEAYEVLRDPEKREKYDRLGSSWRTGDPVPDSEGFGGADFGGGVHFSTGDDFSDFFDRLFGGRRTGAGPRRPGDGFGGTMPLRGADHEATIDLTLEEAAAGGTRRLSLGDGRSYEVKIPVGTRAGQRIRLAGEGGPGADGGPSGDLFLKVRIKPHPGFRLEGNDLYVDVPISPSEAALGAEVPVPTLTGTARVRVPAGSSTGRRLRLRDEGMPTRDGGHGDLYAQVQIVVPRHLEGRERELYEELAAASSFDPRKVK